MRNKITLGSLFDGSGGFPLAGCMCGIEPIWASEIEPYPIAVTKARFQRMKHLGDVQKINGAEIDPVDVITFGSPCQDMSVAGKRAGMQHTAKGDEDTTRSGLFFEAIRIIREMRGATNGKHPTFAVWENVPGAFSSNGGADFKAVLEELASVARGERVSIPFPEDSSRVSEGAATSPPESFGFQSGAAGRCGRTAERPVRKRRWLNAGEIVGDGFSIAWRVLDAQYWGVPQRRKRIYLVTDFAGGRAGEILFERDCMLGNTAESGEAGQRTSENVERSAGGSCVAFAWANSAGAGLTESDKVSPTIKAARCGEPAVITENRSVKCLNPHDSQTIRQYDIDGVYPVLSSNSGGGQNRSGVRYEVAAFMGGQGSKAGGIGYAEEIAPTIKSVLSGGNTVPDVVYCLQGNGIDRALTAGCNGAGWRENESYTLNTIDRPAVCFAADCRNGSLNDELSGTLQAKPNGGYSLNYQNPVMYEVHGLGKYRNGCGTLRASGGDCGRGSEILAVYPDITGSLCANSHPGSYTGQDAFNNMLPVVPSDKPHRKYIVRRLTPIECCRLQGFPDGWGDIPTQDCFTEDDAVFWEEVRRTHARAMGKAYKPFRGKDALVKWYNKLHTDSAEYKMWGNGIALPCSVFVLSGIADAIANNADGGAGMAWTIRDKYPCYECQKRMPGCQDWCPDMRTAKEKNEARKAVERTMRTLETDLFIRNRSGRERER